MAGDRAGEGDQGVGVHSPIIELARDRVRTHSTEPDAFNGPKTRWLYWTIQPYRAHSSILRRPGEGRPKLSRERTAPGPSVVGTMKCDATIQTTLKRQTDQRST